MIELLGSHRARHQKLGFPGFLAMAIGLCFASGIAVPSAPAVTGPIKKVVHQYALTSANDFPQRDPQDWRLLASNDGGRTWTTLDVRRGEIFSERHQRKLYKIDNELPFETYRFQIDKIREPGLANSVQLAELELMGRSEDNLDPVPAFTDIITTHGDNPPAETVANLFDGRVETKWLDWPSNQLNSISWVQWQYAIPAEVVVTNIGQLLALRARAADGFPVEIATVVVGRIDERGAMSFADHTACSEFGGIEGVENLGAGQKILLSGVSEWVDNHVQIKNGRARPIGPKATAHPAQILLEQPWSENEDLKWVEVQGEIQYRHLAENEFSFDLQDGALSMRVYLRCGEKSNPLPPSGTRVSVRGLCLGAFNEQGRRVAANLWAAGLASLTILDQQTRNQPPVPLALNTNQAPLASTTFATIEQIRRLSTEQLRSHPHVKIRGVVTGQLGGFIQDDTAGIEVVYPPEESRKITEVGDYLEVEGVGELGEVGNPVMSAEHVTLLGRGKLPQPERMSLVQLMGGRMDAQWIEVEGVVRSTDGAHLLIICYGRELMASVAVAPAEFVNGLVDAEVRVRGVGITASDEQGRVQGVHILIPSLEHVEVVRPPPDPAALPVRPVGSLLGVSGLRQSFHRVKVQGVVTLQENQRIFLQDESGCAMGVFKEDAVLDSRFGRSRWLYWRTPHRNGAAKSTPTLRPGERVQLTGFPGAHRFSPVLTEVTVNELGFQETPKPVAITTDGIEEGGLDSSLVTMDGVLRDQNTIGSNIFLALEWQDRTLQVVAPRIKSDSLLIPIGSRLRVTGVCQIDPAPYAELGLRVGAVRILTRTPDDLTILATPPWWTLRRALIFMGGMALVILAALIWIKALQRQVGERTVQLTSEIQLREQTEHNRALEQERARIAKDLHDDLGANLTQIVFLSERVEVARRDGQEAARWFHLIPATAQRTIQSLDEIVWAINPRHDSLESLANYLSQFAQEHLMLAQVRCVLDVPMVLPSIPLNANVRHNLLLATREALQNAVTHAAATEVHLTLKLDEDGLNISVTDNGKGFDANSVSSDGNGLRNMQRRMQSIGGHLEINSRPGHGTIVKFRVPDQVLHGRVMAENNDSIL